MSLEHAPRKGQAPRWQGEPLWENASQWECATKRLLKLKQVLAITTLSKSSIYKMIASGDFPRPVRVGAKAVAWREDALIEWIEGLPAAGEIEP